MSGKICDVKSKGHVSKERNALCEGRLYLFKQIGVFSLTYVSYASLYSVRKPFKPKLTEELGFSMLDHSRIETGFLSMYAFGQLVLPALAVRWAEPPLIFLITFCGSAVCAFVFGSSSSLHVMVIAWVLNGVLHSVVYPLFVRSLAVWFSPTVRGRVLGTWTTSQQVGSLVATGFASYASEEFGWRSTLYIPGVIVATMGIVNFLLMPRNPPQNSQGVSAKDIEPQRPKGLRYSGSGLASLGAIRDATNSPLYEGKHKTPSAAASVEFVQMAELLKCGGDQNRGSDADALLPQRTTSRLMSSLKFRKVSMDDGPASIEIQSRRSAASTVAGNCPPVNISLWRVLNIPDIKCVASAFFFIKCVRYSLLFWLSTFLVQSLHVSIQTAGYISMLYDLGGIPGAMLAGLVADKLLSGRRLLAATIMTFCASALILLFDYMSRLGLVATSLALFLVGFGVAGPDSIMGAAAAQDLCERSPYGIFALSAAAGVVNGMGSSGAVFQSYLTASIAERYGWGALFYTLSTFLLIAMCLLLTTLKREYRHTQLMLAHKDDIESHYGSIK